MKYFIGFLMIAVGTFEVMKSDWIIRNFGIIPWAEDKFGSGGTWTFHKILGILIILLAFMLMSGQVEGILQFLFVR